MKKVNLLQGNNIDLLKTLPDNSIDSVVTDGPYGIVFMNKKWDYDVPSVEFWKEVYRVLKPGGHVLSFGGTRTYHRMAVNIEDAGFEIRDQIMWLYGSGFPKSHNIGKAVDKFGGNNLLSTEIGSKLKEARTSRGLTLKQADELFCNGTSNYNWLEGRSDGQRIPNQELFDKIVTEWPELKDLRDKVVASERALLGVEITNKTVMKNIGETNVAGEYERTKGNSPYEGWGTALKPANEPICLARKPSSEKSVAENVLKWGTGGINVDGCRVGIVGKDDRSAGKRTCNIFDEVKVSGGIDSPEYIPNDLGRFPANLILECICDEVIKGEKGEVIKHNGSGGIWDKSSGEPVGKTYNDKGDIHTNPNCPCRLLDEQSGVSDYTKKKDGNPGGKTFGGSEMKATEGYWPKDKGGASRFFYQAKVSKSERNMGLDGFEDKVKNSLQVNMADGVIPDTHNRFSSIVKNNHPTVKPINLMTYLCRLITPKGGIVLDPFMGSGSTGIAAQLEGFRFVGMEMDPEYFKIAEARIDNYEKYKKFLK